MGLDTCAGCGLCSTACPVGIDTGDLTRRLRGRRLGGTSRSLNAWTGEHFATLANVSRLGLKAGHLFADVLGESLLGKLSGGAWKRRMPKPGAAPRMQPAQGDPVVYFPTCGGRIFGPSTTGTKQLGDVIGELLVRAGYAPILPDDSDQLCCGQMLASKGMAQEAESMSQRLEAALLKASENGKYPIIMDASTCTLRMQKHLLASKNAHLRLYDFHEFAVDALLPRLMLHKQPGPVALHINCSVRKGGGEGKLRQLLNACVDEVIEPAGVTCCGFAGDRGFVVPELNRHALRKIHDELPAACACGVSTNRTCEIGLTAETGRNYQSVAYLLEECSRPQETC